MLDLSTAAIVDFPLRGEWRALRTPADRVPTHGTDYFGQRYAFDFARLDPERSLYYERGLFRHLFGALPASSFFCWDQPVHAAFAGRVIAVGDGWPDRLRVNLFSELFRATFAPPTPVGRDYRPLAGNFVMLEGDVGVALYAHLRSGSVRVREGQAIGSGELLGAVGNSGNTTMPHLHFHLMDAHDPLTAAGRLCAFREYERFEAGKWVRVERGVPSALERVRHS